jgi:hypothetical protein
LVNDVAVDDISEYLKGVDAVIHAAAPLPSKGDSKALVNVSLFSLFWEVYLPGCFVRVLSMDL